jgi:large subunit ribosomal protein L9
MLCHFERYKRIDYAPVVWGVLSKENRAMKVILLDYVYKHGVAGEVINVADGFARNFLIPTNLAVKATPGALKRAAGLREQAVARRAALENRLNELAKIIDGVELFFERRAASTGKLFGSVTTQEIADALMEETEVDINRRRISQQPLREIGTHEVPVRLGTETSPVLKVTIVREGELVEYLRKRKAAEGGEEVDADESEPVAEEVAFTSGDSTEVLPLSVVEAALEAGQAAEAEAESVEAESVEAEAEEDDSTGEEPAPEA